MSITYKYYSQSGTLNTMYKILIFFKNVLTNRKTCAIIIHALGICVMVAQQTLTLYVWVRALDPQPFRTQLNHLGLTESFLFLQKKRSANCTPFSLLLLYFFAKRKRLNIIFHKLIIGISVFIYGKIDFRLFD